MKLFPAAMIPLRVFRWRLTPGWESWDAAAYCSALNLVRGSASAKSSRIYRSYVIDQSILVYKISVKTVMSVQQLAR